MNKILTFILENQYTLTAIKIILTWFITKLSIKYCYKVIEKSVINKTINNENNKGRYETLGNVAKVIAKYGIWFISIIVYLTIIFGPIPLTFAGVGATVLGFGSQSLIKDITCGVFILFEGQYAIGDHVTILDIEGIVEAVELRVTKIRGFNGDIHIIPNGLIPQITNHSNGPQRFEVYITVDHNADHALVEKTLIKCCDELNSKEKLIVENATLIGISTFTNTGTTYRILGKGKPLSKVGIETSLRKIIQDAFTKNNIKLASIKN